MASRAFFGALGGIGLTAGAAVALATGWFPTPSVSVSTLTVPAADSAAVVVRWTTRCDTVQGVRVCPTSHDLVLVGDYGDGTATLAERTLAVRALRDTLRFERPVCPMTLRVRAEVAAPARAGMARSATGRSLWQTIRCSPMTAAEQRFAAARADSFPSGTRRVTTGDTAYRATPATRDVELERLLRGSTTRADSARHRAAYAATALGADRVALPHAADTLHADVGYGMYLCVLGRNRYTGAVVVLEGDATACEAPRARWQLQRSS